MTTEKSTKYSKNIVKKDSEKTVDSLPVFVYNKGDLILFHNYADRKGENATGNLVSKISDLKFTWQRRHC
jgi:hypothetical protein